MSIHGSAITYVMDTPRSCFTKHLYTTIIV